MISHLRLAASNPSYRPPSNLQPKRKGKAIGRAGNADRTTLMQHSMRASMHAQHNPYTKGVAMTRTGDMPTHLHGRGHLEGTHASKNEGLLENKQQKRKRRRVTGEKGEGEKEDGYSLADSEEDDEEERKVWKPSSSSTSPNEKENPFSKSSSLPSPSPSPSPSSSSSSSNEIEGEIQSLTKEGLDWSKTSKFGKKSNTNFEKWLSEVAEKLHKEQVEHEDVIFTMT